MFEKIKQFLFKNTTTKQTVAKNTIWLSISNFGGRLIKAGVIIYAARLLGTSGYGVFSYAITLAGFLTLFMDPGINGILMRDVSRAGEEEQKKIFGTMLVIKIILLIIGVAVIIFIAPLFSTLPGAKLLLPIVALVLAFDTLREFFFSLIRAMEKMQWEAGIFLLTNLGIMIFGFIFLYLSATAQSFTWGYVAGDAIGTIATLIVLKNYFKDIFSYFSGELVLPTLKAAWPFAISGTLGMLFTNTDILIISWMRTASDVGIYSAAIRVIQTLYLVPGIIQFSTLPVLARFAKTDNAKFRTVLERTLAIVFMASIPLSIGGIVFGTSIMGIVFGAPYEAGGLSFKILIATLVFDFAASIIINALFAYDHQKSLVISSGLGGVVNVGFDLLLIPHFGIVGSAVATLIAQIVNNGYLWYAMKKINYFSVLGRLTKMVSAGAIMGIAGVAFVLAGMNMFVNILACIIIYFISLKLFKEPLIKEMEEMVFAPKVTA